VLHRDLDRRVAAEGHFAGKELVEDDPHRVDVRPRVRARTPRLLGREVLRRADDRAHLGHLARAGAGDPEVGHLQPAVAADDDVVRLDVAVDDPVAVRETDRAEDLARVVDRDRGRRRAVPDEKLLDRAPVEVFHRDVVGALGLAAVVDRDDVRVREASRVLGFAPEPLDELVVLRVAVVEDLDRDRPAQLLVLREVDVRHSTRAQLADDLVAAVEHLIDEHVGNWHVLSSTPPAESPA
jgi:hypothetical protein